MKIKTITKECGVEIEALKSKVAELEQICEELDDFYNNAPCALHSANKDGVFVRINDVELCMLLNFH